MKNILIALLAITFLSCDRSNQKDAANTIFVNGKIYTVSEGQPWAEAVAIKDGKFLKVGSSADIRKLAGDETIVIDLEGKLVLPGLNDHHCHPLLDGYMRSKGDIPGTIIDPTFEEMVGKIKEVYDNLPHDAEWFISSGHTAGKWPKEKYNRQFLDELIPDKPAYLEDETGHNALVNTKALEIAGITKDSPDPDGGEFERDENGELTGHMIEFGAINIFKYKYLPQPSINVYAKGLEWAIELFNSYGFTGFGDADAYGNYPEIYAKVIRDGNMTVHPTLYLHSVGFDGPESIIYSEELLKQFDAYELPGVKMGAKIFSDGSVEGNTARLVEPYLNTTDNVDSHAGTRIDGPDYDGAGGTGFRGNLTLDYEIMKKVVQDLEDHNIQIKVHAVGDGAVREMLDIFEEVLPGKGQNVNRHQIDHLNLVHDEDLPRFAELDITAGPYPSIASPNGYQTNVVMAHLGEERWNHETLRFKSLIDNGARLAFKSDWASIPMWPFYGMQSAVTRETPGKDNGVLNESERISIEEAVKAYTINGAYALQIDDVSGSIEVGKFADMIVLDQNIFEVPSNEIYKTQVLQTLFKGKVVYETDVENLSDRAPSMEHYLTMAGVLDGCPSCVYVDHAH